MFGALVVRLASARLAYCGGKALIDAVADTKRCDLQGLSGFRLARTVDPLSSMELWGRNLRSREAIGGHKGVQGA
jgi:hypothetical protein